MRNNIVDIVSSFSTLLENSHLNVNLQGWPAAVAVIAIGISGVSLYALHIMASDSPTATDL